MFERLYCPDYYPVFWDESYRYPFDLPLVDGLVWPLFNENPVDTEKFDLTKSHSPMMYKRKISLGEFALEMRCSDIGIVCLQAFEANHPLSIPNTLVMETLKNSAMFRAILAYTGTKDSLKLIESNIQSIAGVVVYPTYAELNICSEAMHQLIELLKKNGIPLKIDTGIHHMIKNNPEFVTPEKLEYLITRNPDLKIIISGIDLLGKGKEHINLACWYPNVSIEIDPRAFGGFQPKDYFKQLFVIPGFVQNCWSKLILGSATPTLEVSQLTRALYEATEDLPFAHKCLLRTWAFRNAHRVYRLGSKGINMYNHIELPKYQAIIHEDTVKVNQNHTIITADLKIESFSITQLIYLSETITKWVNEILKKPEYSNANGQLLIKSNHTTVSLIVNEHEVGNYLELHFKFCEESMKNVGQAMHTVKADEHRADFNFQDHLMASTYGHRELVIPIIKSKMKLGARENIYILSTFGPRAMTMTLQLSLFKPN